MVFCSGLDEVGVELGGGCFLLLLLLGVVVVLAFDLAWWIAAESDWDRANCGLDGGGVPFGRKIHLRTVLNRCR